MDRMLELVDRGYCQQNAPDLHGQNVFEYDVKDLPLNSLEEVLEFETKLENNQFFSKTVSII